MIEIYYWEGDPQAEELMAKLDRQGREYKATQLDPEAGGGEPSVSIAGHTYWSFDEALEALKPA